MNKIGLLLMIVVGMSLAACGKHPCEQLAKQACELATGTPACEKASHLTANDECSGYLKDVKRYVELSNLTVTTPALTPPAPPAPPAPPVPTAQPEAVPAAAPAAAPTPAPAN